MSRSLRRVALLLTALTALGVGALGQGVTAAAQSSAGAAVLTGDALPKHPIPYRAFKDRAKPRLKPKPKPAALPVVGAPGASGVPGAPPPAQGQRTPGLPLAAQHPALPQGAKPPAPRPVAAPPPAVSNKPALAAPVLKAAPAPVVKPIPTPAPVAKPPIVAAPVPIPVPVMKAAPPAPPPPPPKPLPPVQAVTGPPPPALTPPQPGARLEVGQPIPAGELEAFVDGQVIRAMQADHVAGVTVSVVQNGQLVLEKGYGRAALWPVRKMDPRATLVRLGSASQVFTWIAALKAVEEGRLNLDAPVNSYLPDDLKIPDEGFNQPVLVRHLMSHTAGFEDRALGRRYVNRADDLMPLDQALQALKPRRVRAPGTLSVPSDYGVALAGRVVAKVDGRPFDQMIETTIIKPLGLAHTSFREPYAADGRLPDPLPGSLGNAISQGFMWDAEGLNPAPFAYGQSLAPATSASTTADDMARLMIALLGGGKLGGVSIYGPKAAALLRAPLQHPAPGVEGWAHGLALQRLPGGLEMLTDSGGNTSFHSNLALVPGMELGVFVSANTDTGGPLARDLPGALVQRFYAAPEHVASQGGPETSFEGHYLSARRAYHGLEAFADRLSRQSTLTADAATGGVVLSSNGDQRLYEPTGEPGRFQTERGEELLTPTEDGRAQAYVLGSGGGAAERVGGIHSRAVLEGWAAGTLLTVLATFAGLFIRERIDPRETRRQIAANVTQIVTCLIWCIAFAAFAIFAKRGLSPVSLMFDWPNRWLVIASWAALIAGVLSVVMVTQIPGAWREERRIHGWSIWRKIRHTSTVGVFVIFTAILAAWGALEPWSS